VGGNDTDSRRCRPCTCLNWGWRWASGTGTAILPAPPTAGAPAQLSGRGHGGGRIDAPLKRVAGPTDGYTMARNHCARSGTTMTLPGPTD